MKLGFTILITSIVFSCKNGHELKGNYAACVNGEYTEVYFKKDSMRMASENLWIKLSEWRKIEIVNDTLYFETFGEWSNPTKAKIKYRGQNAIDLKFSTNQKGKQFEMIQSLERIERDFDFNDPEKFWAEFKIRKSATNCNSER